jgi:hypothetical protein
MGQEPQIPNIAPVQTAPTVPSEDIGAMLGQYSQQATAPLPPRYIQGTSVAEPRLPPAPQFTPKNENNAPMTQQATSIKMARDKNAFAEIANTLGKAGQVLQERKQTLLKEDLKTVMTAKQNVANAQVVLQQDPTNKMAQAVLDANKKQLEAILSDPKKQKQLSKALDISFTDMDKNKKPEVVAGQQAIKEFKGEGQFTYNNPDEAKVAAQAHEASQPKSQTPRADAALAKDLPSIQPNPEYDAALKNQQTAQAKLTQYVIPQLIKQESAAQIQAVKDGNAAARAEFKATTDFAKAAKEIQGRIEVANTRAKSAMAVAIQRDSSAMARTTMEVNARLKIANDKRLDPNTSMKLKTEALDKVDQSLKAITAERLSLNQQLLNTKDDEEKKTLGHLLDYNKLKAEATNVYRQKVATEVYGKVSEGSDGRLGAGSTKKVAGTDLSDEPDEDEDDDSDDY